ncbi:hypothetical protein R80B4_02467 [Fibrobacteres bacterium R8-0-B4]
MDVVSRGKAPKRKRVLELSCWKYKRAFTGIRAVSGVPNHIVGMTPARIRFSPSTARPISVAPRAKKKVSSFSG